MPLLILNFNAGLFVAYVNVFRLAIIWLLWYTDVRCCKAVLEHIGLKLTY